LYSFILLDYNIKDFKSGKLPFQHSGQWKAYEILNFFKGIGIALLSTTSLDHEILGFLRKTFVFVRLLSAPHLFTESLLERIRILGEEILEMSNDVLPITEQTIGFHNIRHWHRIVKLNGSPRSYWMFPVERFGLWTKESGFSNRFPESSMHLMLSCFLDSVILEEEELKMLENFCPSNPTIQQSICDAVGVPFFRNKKSRSAGKVEKRFLSEVFEEKFNFNMKVSEFEHIHYLIFNQSTGIETDGYRMAREGSSTLFINLYSF